MIGPKPVDFHIDTVARNGHGAAQQAVAQEVVGGGGAGLQRLLVLVQELLPIGVEQRRQPAMLYVRAPSENRPIW